MIEGGKEFEVSEYREKKFSKILDDDEKSRLESRFCADNEKRNQQRKMKSSDSEDCDVL